MYIPAEFVDDKIINNLAATKIFSLQIIQYHTQTIVIGNKLKK